MNKQLIKDTIAEVTSLEVRSYSLSCPHCGNIEDGFLGDCRGEVLKCESCGKDYKIHEEADFEII